MGFLLLQDEDNKFNFDTESVLHTETGQKVKSSIGTRNGKFLIAMCSGVSLNHSKGSCCFLEQETLQSMLSTGWF